MKHLLVIFLLVTALTGCGKPRGALDRYIAAKPAVANMRPLVEMLLRGDVQGFNQLRKNPQYAGKRLDFRGHSFAGLSLEGADLSDAILANVDFTGANLNRASFRGSYVATMRLAQPYSLEVDVATTIGRPTSLVQADFTGSVITAVEYYEDYSNGFGGWRDAVMSLREIGLTDCTNAIGLESLAHEKPNRPLPFHVISGKKSLHMSEPTRGARYVEDVRSALELGESCANPFLEIDPRGQCFWGAAGVQWASLTNLPAVRVRGSYYGAGSIKLVNSDPSLVVVLGPDFGGHGDVFSKGPIVVDGAHLMGNVYAEGPVWLRNHAYPREKVVGQFIFAETTIKGSSGTSWLSPVIRVPPVGIAGTNAVSTVVMSHQQQDHWLKGNYWFGVAEGNTRKPAEYWLSKLKEPSAMIRFMAIKRLTELSEPPGGIRRAIEPLLTDSDPQVAKAAAAEL